MVLKYSYNAVDMSEPKISPENISGSLVRFMHYTHDGNNACYEVSGSRQDRRRLKAHMRKKGRDFTDTHLTDNDDFQLYLKTIGASLVVSSIMLSAPDLAHAGPQGGVVAGGNITIVDGISRTDIHQSSQQGIIDWDSFNIGQEETVRFHQPDANSMTLNRVHDTAPSVIRGRLEANGVVLISNANGVMFSDTASVDVGSLVATSADIADDDFMAGNLDFSIAGNQDAEIINDGSITIKEAGIAAFVGPTVKNNGIIKADLGKVVLASGEIHTLDLYGDGLVEVAVTDDIQQEISNSGTIEANGGDVLITASAAKEVVDTVINMSGVIEANAVEAKGGVIRLFAPGSNKTAKSGTSKVTVSGSMDVAGTEAGQTGGTVDVYADQIEVKKDAVISADGANGGGTVHIGGEYLGGGDTTTAETLTIENGSKITANALLAGEGGEVIAWSDTWTQFYGGIEAKGAGGEQGGFVETSGKDVLTATGSVEAGTWLLDPNSITIRNAGPDTNVTGDPIFTTTDDSAIVTTASIEAALDNGTDVIIQTSNGGSDSQAGRITIQNDIFKTAGSDATLRLLAHESIIMSNADIISTSGRLNLVFNADSDAVGGGAINITNANILTNNGSVIMGGGADPSTTAAIGTSAHNDGITLNNVDLITGAGDVSLRGSGRMGGGGANEYGIVVTGGSVIQTTTGDMSLIGTGGDISNRNYGIYFNGATTNLITDIGAITVTGTGGGTNNTENFGVYMANASITSNGDGAGDIRVTGQAGATNTTSGYGVYMTGGSAAITSATGDIYVDGTGQGNGSGNNSYGIYLRSGPNIISTGTGSDAAQIILTGNSNAGRDNNQGIYFDNGDIASVDGNISMTGYGADSSRHNNYGIYLRNGSTVNSTGLATIDLAGYGGDGNRQGYGVYINGNTSAINTVFGDLNITGRGGDGTGYRNYGILINGGADIASTGVGENAATITMNGRGGDGQRENYGLYFSNGGTTVTSVDGDMTFTGIAGTSASASNRGVIIGGGSVISSTGMGDNAANISFTATAADGGTSSNYGMQLGGANGGISAAIETVDGDITINATGGDGSTDNNYGFYFYGTGKIISTGVGESAGTITLNAIGGDGRRQNYGLYMRDSGTLMSSVDGAINILGQAGDGTQYRNRGVFIERSADISSTGTGANAATIDITGIGGTGNYENMGVLINSGGTTINSVDGDININAQGGDGTTQRNYGFYMTGGSRINSTGTTMDAATIDIDGVAGSGTYENYGVYLNGGSTQVTSIAGAIDILGQGGTGTSHRNYGVYILNGADILSTGTGANAATIDLTGVGGTGSGNSDHGIYLDNSPTATRSVDGDVTISGTAGLNGSNNYGIIMYRNSRFETTGDAGITLTAIGDGVVEDFYGYNGTPRVGGPSATGDIVINVDSLRLVNSMRFQTSGDITLAPRSDTTTIGLGSGSGDITLTNATLTSRFLDASKLIFGSATSTALIDVDGLNVAREIEILGGDIDIHGGGLTSSGAVTLRATDDINIMADITANGDVLAIADNDFIATGTMGTPITIETNGNSAVFVSDNAIGRGDGILNINQYVTVNTAPNDFRVYGVSADQVTIEGIVNAMAMADVLPNRVGNYSASHTGYGLFYEPQQLPGTVVRTTYRGDVTEYNGNDNTDLDVVIDGIDDINQDHFLLKIHADLAPFFANWTYVQSVNYKIGDFKNNTTSFAFMRI